MQLSARVKLVTAQLPDVQIPKTISERKISKIKILFYFILQETIV